MPLEISVRDFAKSKGIELKEMETGFGRGTNGRVQINYMQEQGNYTSLCEKFFALREIYESSVCIFNSANILEVTVNVRFGCLRDYLHQLHDSKKFSLMKLRQKLELHLGDNKAPESIVSERFNDFNSSDIYQLLNSFYP
ncbi:MAG: hypothetical protein AABW53_00885 [Nanoarchaeota archaeon]